MIGSKPDAEAADTPYGVVVEERPMCVEAVPEGHGGAHGSENADMSNEKPGENPGRRNSKVSWGRFVPPGSVGP